MDKYWSNTETGKWHFVSKACDDYKQSDSKTDKRKVQMFYGEVKIKGYFIIALLKHLEGKGDIGPHLNLYCLYKCRKSRYFHQNFSLNGHCNKDKRKSHSEQ